MLRRVIILKVFGFNVDIRFDIRFFLAIVVFVENIIRVSSRFFFWCILGSFDNFLDLSASGLGRGASFTGFRTRSPLIPGFAVARSRVEPRPREGRLETIPVRACRCRSASVSPRPRPGFVLRSLSMSCFPTGFLSTSLSCPRPRPRPRTGFLSVSKWSLVSSLLSSLVLDGFSVSLEAAGVGSSTGVVSFTPRFFKFNSRLVVWLPQMGWASVSPRLGQQGTTGQRQ